MVFCLKNKEARRLSRSAMVHFQASEVQQLLHNKFVVILGDSIQRAVYKDLVLLLQKDSLLTAAQLKAKLQPLASSLRRDVVEGNFYSATLAGDHCFDVLDLHFHFRHAVRHRHRDGVHWDQHAHRHLSHLLLTHVADAWGVELPKRDSPPDPWIEDWPETDHLFQGSHKQPPGFGEQLALPLPLPSPLPPPLPFPYSLPQPLPPPVFPPLPQDVPLFPGQTFPPHEFFNFKPMEDSSMAPHLGCCPGVNFVPGLLPSQVPGLHGRQRGPVVHRGMPRCVSSSPYQVPRMGVPCRQRFRHSDKLIQAHKLERRPAAHSGTWPG